MPPAPRRIDWMILAALVAAWGSSFAMTKIAVTHVDAAWVMALRLVVAALVLVPIAYVRGDGLRASQPVWAKFTWLGFIGNALPFLLVTWGTARVSSGVSGLLMGTIPLFLVVMAHVALPDERLTLAKAAGFSLGFCGIVILMGPDQIGAMSFAGPALQGELAILAGCLCYALHAVSAKRLGLEAPAKQSAAVCLTAAVMGLAYAAATDPQGLAGASPAALAAIIGLGLVPTALATVMVYWLMDRVGPSFVSFANYLVPIFAVVLGAAVLGETVNGRVLAALLCILAGIAISRLPARRAKPGATPA